MQTGMTRSTFALLACAALAHAADHKEAPLIAEDPSADIADIYVFTPPGATDSVVLVMTVNPFSAATEGVNFRFSPNVRYRFEVDTDLDGISNRTVTVTFSEDGGAFDINFPGPANDFTGLVTQPTEEPMPNPPIINTGGNGLKAFAGPRDDPFFFDFVGFSRFLAGTGAFSGTDSFAGFNTSAIVIETPLNALTLGATNFAVWGATDRRSVTLRRGSRGQLERELGPWEQVERMGNPAVATALVPAGRKDFYNIGVPADDASDFAADIVASLQSLGTTQENINILASVAVPDTLKIDVTQPSAFPNGRAPADDVIDTLLFFIFNQTPVSDDVQENDVPFMPSFPYLAPPHQPS
ncbi:MAG: DUF4331 family protein [Phycisphaerales bacterium]|nr:DUF4331 family protein [Phycisphaerales bacterium]